MIAIPAHSDMSYAPVDVIGEPSNASCGSKSGFADLLEKVQGRTPGPTDPTGKDTQSPATKKKNGDPTSSPALLCAINSLVPVPPPPQAIPSPAVATAPTDSPLTIADDFQPQTGNPAPVNATGCNPAEVRSSVPSWTASVPPAVSNPAAETPGNRDSGTEKIMAKVVDFRDSVLGDPAPSPPPSVVNNDVIHPVVPRQIPVAPEAAPNNDTPAPSISMVGGLAAAMPSATMKATDNKPPVASKSNSAKSHRFSSRDLQQAVEETKNVAVPWVKSVGRAHDTRTQGDDPQQTAQPSGQQRLDAGARFQMQDAKVSAADKEPAQPRPLQNHGASQEPTEPQPSGTPSEHAAPTSGILSVAGAPPHVVLENREPENPTGGLPQAEQGDTSPNPAANVNLARVVEGLSRSEMHIGLRTAAFGAVEVHTVIRENQVGVSVGTERGDLKTLLATEVPTLHTALRHQDLHFEGIRFLSDSAGLRSDLGGGGRSDARPFRQSWSQRAESSAANEIPAAAPLPENNSALTGLSVHA